MAKNAVLNVNEKIGDTIAGEVTGAWDGRVTSQFLVGKITLTRGAPAAVPSRRMSQAEKQSCRYWTHMTKPHGWETWSVPLPNV